MMNLLGTTGRFVIFFTLERGIVARAKLAHSKGTSKLWALDSFMMNSS